MGKNKSKPAFQFSLFGYQPPRLKVPISAARIAEAKALMLKGDLKGSATLMREVREGLEAFERRLSNKQTEVNHG